MVELPAATCEFARVQALAPVAEFAVEPVQALDQRPASSYSGLAFAVGVRRRPTAFEQPDPQFALERLQLQGHRRLAEVERLGRARHRPSRAVWQKARNGFRRSPL
jgi:hypothetical protein